MNFFVAFSICPRSFIFAMKVAFVRTRPCPSGSSIIGRLFWSRATEWRTSGFEKSTPVSTMAIVTPAPV